MAQSPLRRRGAPAAPQRQTQAEQESSGWRLALAAAQAGGSVSICLEANKGGKGVGWLCWLGSSRGGSWRQRGGLLLLPHAARKKRVVAGARAHAAKPPAQAHCLMSKGVNNGLLLLLLLLRPCAQCQPRHLPRQVLLLLLLLRRWGAAE